MPAPSPAFPPPQTTKMMKTVASILLLATSSAEAFAPAATATTATPSTTALDLAGRANTRRRIEGQELGIWPQSSCRDPATGSYAPCDAAVAVPGREVRAKWPTYAPPHGSPPLYGAIGCPGGGDWCYASGYGAAGALPPSADAKKRAAIVAAALAGLGRGTGGAREVAGGSIPRLSSGGISMAGLMLASKSGGGVGSVMGEDARDSRGSYAPCTRDGRVGAPGVIGAGGAGGGGGHHEPAAPAARMALPPSSSSTSSAASKPKSPGRPKKYGLGSWKK
jgi:hypothetical protein